MKKIILENDKIRAEFDKSTGALKRLYNKGTCWEALGDRGLELSFEFLVPLPDRENNPVIGNDQVLSEAYLSDDGMTACFEWDGVKTKYGLSLDIKFIASVQLKESGLLFKGEVLNNSPYTVSNVCYPCLGDLKRPVQNAPFYSMSLAYAGFDRKELFPHFWTERGYWGTEYPVQIVAPPWNSFVLISAEKQGIYVGNHEESIKGMLSYYFELKPGVTSTMQFSAPESEEINGKPVHIDFKVVHFPFVASGEEVQIEPVEINFYEGSWHNGVDFYKAWLKTWHKPAQRPKWTREVHSWQQIQMNSSADELRYRYTDLVSFGQDCVRHGVDAIQVVGWTVKGQDGKLPCHDIDPRLGTWEELKDAIEKIQAMGVKVVLYNKFTFAETGTEWFKDELYKYASKDINGDIHSFPGYSYMSYLQLQGVNTHRLAVMCFNCPEWIEISKDEFTKCVSLKPDGILFDETPNHCNMNYCYDPNHGHRIPAYNYSGNEIMDREFVDIAKRENPDFLMAGEGLYEREQMYYSLSYIRAFSLEHEAVQRYINPDMDIMLGVFGYDDRQTINLCLMHRYIISYEPLNFKGRLDDFTLTLNYGKSVDALRKLYSRYLWDADYLDRKGASVKVNGEDYTRYTVFRCWDDGKKAVVLANFKEKESLEVSVSIEDKKGDLMMVTPENHEMQAFNEKVSLQPRSAVVILEV